MIESMKESLLKKIRGLKIDERFSKDSRVMIYEQFLRMNLEYSFDQVCNADDGNNIQSIQGIYLLYGELDFLFSIEVTCNNYRGRYTAWCPELVGCITEGKSKREALNNLCFAIAEVLILNYELLGINPILKYGKTPEVTADFFIDVVDFPCASISPILYVEYGFTEFYLGTNHLLLKNPRALNITLTFPYQGFQQLTKHMIENTVEHLR